MPLTLNPIPLVDELVFTIISGAEGEASVPKHVGRENGPGDGTITLGYGYTFLRKSGNNWTIYPTLTEDLKAIDIVLTPSELEALRGDLPKDLWSIQKLRAAPGLVES